MKLYPTEPESDQLFANIIVLFILRNDFKKKTFVQKGMNGEKVQLKHAHIYRCV